VNNSYYNGSIDSQTGEYEYEGLDIDWLSARLQEAVDLGKIPVVIAHQIEPSGLDSDFDTICATYGVRLVLRGHTHIAINSSKAGTNYFIANAGAFIKSYESTYGVTIIEMTEQYFVSTNRQYTMSTGTFTESSANVMEFDKDIAADYYVGRKMPNNYPIYFRP
jgi:predicted phosphodiesterase